MNLNQLFENTNSGGNYAEQLAKKLFDADPNIGDENAVLDAAWPLAAQDLGNKRARYIFAYDEDFPSDLVSVYGLLQKGMTEGNETLDEMSPQTLASYVRKSNTDARDRLRQDPKKQINKAQKRAAGMSQAIGKIRATMEPGAKQQGVAEGSRNAYLKHNNLFDIEKPLAGLKSEFDKFLQTHDPEEKQKYQQGIKQRIKTRTMAGPKGVLPEQGVAEGMDHSPVAGAITRRIMSQRLDLLKKYGPANVAAAIDDVAEFVGDTEEIGSSDVSGWVLQVERALSRMGQGLGEAGGRNYHANTTGFSRGARDPEGQDPAPDTRTWYIRLNGKLIRDKQGMPYSYRGKAAANKAALAMQAKLFNKGKEFVLTTNPNDPQQGVAEQKKNSKTSAIAEGSLKDQSLGALMQARQAIQQRQAAEIDAWKQDFEKNTAAKFTAKQATPTAPVTQPSERHSVLRARLNMLDAAIKKQQQLDALGVRAEKLGLLNEPGIQADLDTSMYVRDADSGKKDNYATLNQHLDTVIARVSNRITQRQAVRKKPQAMAEDTGAVEAWGYAYNRRDQRVMWSQTFASEEAAKAWADQRNATILGMRPVQQSITEGPFVQRIVHPGKISIYVRSGKGSKLIATDIPYEILDKYIGKVIKKYPQFKQTDFSFRSSDKITEFAPPGGDGREPDEEEILKRLAAQWWLGTEQQMARAQASLAAMGWEIGQDESGDDDAGVFVIRAGDENGNSYMAFPHSELSLDEGWSQKYKSSINCSHPKGFSQRAHCAGKKKHNESVEMEMTCPDCGMCETHGDHSQQSLDEACWKGYHKEGMKTMFGKRYPNCVKNKNESLETYIRKGECPGCGGDMVAEGQLNEKQDACYHKVKSRYKVWPSAYASGALVQCRKKGAANWGNSNESITQEEYDQLDENLKKWFSDKWVRFGPDGKIRGACARGDDSEGKPKCLPQSKAYSLGKKGRASAAARKRRKDPNPERSGAAINVNTKKKSNEGVANGSDKKEATLRIQKMLNKKFGANLDVDGIMGPLTLQSINRFMPDADVGVADQPNRTTAVQGKKIKKESRGHRVTRSGPNETAVKEQN